jgi:hypothetical protein
MTLSSTIKLAVAASLATVQDLGTAQAPVSLSQSVQLTSGTAAGQADRIFADTRTLAASGTEDLDLAGALLDGLGGTAVFARIKALIIRAAAGNTNLVQVIRPASNGVPLFMAAGDGIGLRPGETLALVAGPADAIGHVVTAATGDLLTITNSAGTTGVSYDIVVIGCSA